MKHYSLEGKTLPAIAVDRDLAVGLTSLNKLEDFGVKSPWLMASTKKAALDPGDAPFRELRELVQRAWDKARRERAELYSRYLENVYDGKVAGGSPPVTLFVSQAGAQIDDSTEMAFPYGCTVICIDGETQTEARYLLRKRRPETGSWLFPVTIYHGCTESKARQILHDFNRFAKPIPESKLGVRNGAGGMTQTIVAAANTVNVTLNERGPSGTKVHAASFNQAMFFVTGFAIGGEALQKSASTWFDALNAPGAPPINGDCGKMLQTILAEARANPLVRTAPSYLWQVAGICAGEGKAPNTINWAAAKAAYDEQPNVGEGTGKGGGKGKTADRLAKIYIGFNS